MSDKAQRGAVPLDVVEQVTDIVTAMRTQELTTYRRCDYLDGQDIRIHAVLDASWRQRIVEWMYGVVDHCSLRRDSVATASVYLDICVQRGLVKTREEYQLAAMTALQIAIKLCDSTVVKLQSMVALGRGLFTAQDVIDMERKMLAALNWNCHPPTSVCFLRQFLRLLPPTVPPFTRYMIAEVTRYVSFRLASRFVSDRPECPMVHKSRLTCLQFLLLLLLCLVAADSSPRSPCACTASSSIRRQRWPLPV